MITKLIFKLIVIVKRFNRILANRLLQITITVIYCQKYNYILNKHYYI